MRVTRIADGQGLFFPPGHPSGRYESFHPADEAPEEDVVPQPARRIIGRRPRPTDAEAVAETTAEADSTPTDAASVSLLSVTSSFAFSACFAPSAIGSSTTSGSTNTLTVAVKKDGTTDTTTLTVNLLDQVLTEEYAIITARAGEEWPFHGVVVAVVGRALREHGGGELDVVMLGVGPDGHVASLFPGAAALDVAATAGMPVVCMGFIWLGALFATVIDGGGNVYRLAVVPGFHCHQPLVIRIDQISEAVQQFCARAGWRA